MKKFRSYVLSVLPPNYRYSWYKIVKWSAEQRKSVKVLHIWFDEGVTVKHVTSVIGAFLNKEENYELLTVMYNENEKQLLIVFGDKK